MLPGAPASPDILWVPDPGVWGQLELREEAGEWSWEVAAALS